MVYLIQAEVDGTLKGPIKIGHSSDVPKRMRTMQTTCPFPLVLLLELKGGENVERYLHGRFSRLRVRGEWFLPERDLLDFIGSESHPDYEEMLRGRQVIRVLHQSDVSARETHRYLVQLNDLTWITVEYRHTKNWGINVIYCSRSHHSTVEKFKSQCEHQKVSYSTVPVRIRESIQRRIEGIKEERIVA